MLKKLLTLTAARKLGSFDVEGLATEAKVAPTTVRTVLARCPEDWFRISTEGSGLRGGQWRTYVLTDAGREGIDSELGRVSQVSGSSDASLFVAPGVSKLPTGLGAARTRLAKLREAPAQVAEVLRGQLKNNLLWARYELESNAPTPESIEWMQEVEQLWFEAGLPAQEQETPAAIAALDHGWKEAPAATDVHFHLAPKQVKHPPKIFQNVFANTESRFSSEYFGGTGNYFAAHIPLPTSLPHEIEPRSRTALWWVSPGNHDVSHHLFKVKSEPLSTEYTTQIIGRGHRYRQAPQRLAVCRVADALSDSMPIGEFVVQVLEAIGTAERPDKPFIDPISIDALDDTVAFQALWDLASHVEPLTLLVCTNSKNANARQRLEFFFLKLAGFKANVTAHMLVLDGSQSRDVCRAAERFNAGYQSDAFHTTKIWVDRTLRSPNRIGFSTPDLEFGYGDH